MNADRKEYLKNYMIEYRKRTYAIKQHNISNKNHQQTEKGQVSHYNASKKYSKTKKGKLNGIRQRARRRCNLGFIQMSPNPFTNSELIEWHHITDAYVVALPKELHRQYLGKQHREKTMEIVKQIHSMGEC